MGTSDVFFFICFFLILILLSNISVVIANNCSISSNNSCRTYSLVTRFPFQLEGKQPDSCGYPGFRLTCVETLFTDRAVLDLPHSGEFFVEEIDYVKQEIRLQDPFSCLPKRLLNLNLSDSPFKSIYYQNYTFLKCTYQIVNESISKYIISCLSRGNDYVLATSSMTPVSSFHRYCEVIKTVPIPVPVPVLFRFPFSVDYGSGFLAYGKLTLSWDEPDCRYCEARDQECRLRNTTGNETRCFRKKRYTSGGIRAIPIIPVGLLCFICCIVCCIMNCSNKDNQPSNEDEEISNATSLQPVIPLISLDDSMIDSYPKIVLGESRRLPNPDDNICPICLSEYLPKEILKIIPECNHNFHVDCIDQWLHTNMTCPVCRNYPT